MRIGNDNLTQATYSFIVIFQSQIGRYGLVEREIVDVQTPLHDVLSRALCHIPVCHVVQNVRVFALLNDFAQFA